MRVLVAESDSAQRVFLSVWLAEMSAVELAGLARNHAELLPALHVSKADVLVVAWELLATAYQDVLQELDTLQPRPYMIVIVTGQPMQTPPQLMRGMRFIARAGLPEALRQTLAEIHTQVGNAG